MASILDMSKFQFEGDLIRALSELIFDETINNPDVNTIHTIFPGIVTHREVGFIGKGGLVGVKSTGCAPQAKPWNIDTRVVEWNPETWEILIHQCWTDLEQAATVYSLRTGVDIPNFTDTDYMNLILEVMGKSILDFWYRLYWFNDKDAANVADGGVITNGLDLEYFNVIDGLWKQIIAQAAANPAQKAAVITENLGATYEAQMAMTPENAFEYLSKVYYSAPLVLRNQQDKFILVTQSVYDAYTQYLQTACCIESARTMLMNGVSALMFNGVPVVPMAVWDEMIQAYEDTGVKYNNPHRILFTSKSVLGLGVDNANSFDRIEVWYDRDTRLVKLEAMGRADAKLTNPELFSLAI